MMENISNPFTPKSGWEPRVFLGRKKEIEMFNKKLDDALNNRYDHFLVLGDWGIGKTSLLKRFKKTAQLRNILTSFITIREFQRSDKFIQAVEQLTTEIPRELPIKHENLKNFMDYLKGMGISLPVIGGGIQIPMEVELRGDPQTLLLDSLINLWNDVKKETEVAVVLLDDVQNYSAISGFLTILKNVLSHDEILDTGYLFVLSSTPEGWRQFLQEHHPIGRYFIPRLTLNNLSRDETTKIVDMTLEGTEVVFDNEIKERVYDYTFGQPFELQILCSNLYDNQIGGRISDNVWDTSLDRTIIDLGENVLDMIYEKSSTQERKILYIISLIDKPLGVGDIERIAENNKLELSKNTIATSLTRLVDKRILIKPEKFKYYLQDKLFREYILRYRGYGGNGNSLKLNIINQT